MIDFLEGTLVDKHATGIVVALNGMGFVVSMAAGDIAQLPSLGQSVKVYTYLHVRADALTLSGFLSRAQRACFERLLAVSGIGAKVALTVLSAYSPAELSDIVAQENLAALQKIPGIGKKSASRLMLELKGSLSSFADDESVGDIGTSSGITYAQSALLSMGFTEREAALALKDAPRDVDEAHVLQYALKRLGSS